MLAGIRGALVRLPGKLVGCQMILFAVSDGGAAVGVGCEIV
jgi:hypothetical protein